VATVAVSLPSMLVMVGLVTFTTTSRERKLVEGPLYGLRPTVIALILAAAVDIGRQSIADPLGGLIGIGALVAAFGRVNPILIILGGGTLGLLLA
jgi:chromate transporter